MTAFFNIRTILCRSSTTCFSVIFNKLGMVQLNSTICLYSYTETRCWHSDNKPFFHFRFKLSKCFLRESLCFLRKSDFLCECKAKGYRSLAVWVSGIFNQFKEGHVSVSAVHMANVLTNSHWSQSLFIIKLLSWLMLQSWNSRFSYAAHGSRSCLFINPYGSTILKLSQE